MALVLIVVVAVRLHELVPGLSMLRPTLLSMVVGLGVLFTTSPVAARRAVFRHPLMRLVLAYWLFMAATMPLALWPGLAFASVQAYMPGVALLAAILFCAPDRRSLLRLQVGLVAGVVAYAFYAKLFGRIVADGRLVAGSGMYDSNDMAALLAMTLPLAVGLARAERGRLRLMMALAAVLLVLVTVASGSRGGILAMGAGAVVYALGMRGHRRISAIVVLASAGLALWTFSPDFSQRMGSLANLEDDYNITHEYGRKQIWARGREYIAENPLIGVGVGNFPIAEGNWFAREYGGARGGKWSTAHNAYVQAFAELGILGGSIFIGLLLFGVRRGWRLWRGVRIRGRGLAHRPELMASLASFAAGCYFLSHAYFLPFLALLGLIALADRLTTLELRAARAQRAALAGPGADRLGPPVRKPPGTAGGRRRRARW